MTCECNCVAFAEQANSQISQSDSQAYLSMMTNVTVTVIPNLELPYSGHVIFIVFVIVLTPILILIIFCLLGAVCCLARKNCRLRRQYSSTSNETDPESKDNSYKMVEVGENGGNDAKGSSQVKADAGLEHFAEAMYSTVEEIPVTDSRTKKDHTSGKGQNDLTVDADNYDIITLEGIGHSAKASGKTSKDMKKSKTVSEDKNAGPTETFSPLAEYAVPDKAQKSKKQTSKANLAPAADDKLLPVTSTAQPHLSVQPSKTSAYTNISPDNFKRKSTSMLEPDNNQCQKRGRTSSPPEEPPPLPPPFVDDNSMEVSGANVKLQSDITTALKQNKLGGSSNVNKTDNENAGAFYRSDERVTNEVVDAWPLYDDIEGVAGPQQPQEMYMNVKR